MSDTAMSDGAGVEVEVSFRAKLLAGLSTVAERLAESAKVQREANRRAEQAAALLPIPYRTRAQGFPSSNALVLDLGGPAQGRVWELRHAVVGGELPSDTRAGAAYYYRVGGVLTTQMPGLASMFDVIDWTATLPAVAFYAAGDVTIVGGERLVVVITGATDAENYQAVADVQDRLVTPVDRTTIGA